MSEYEEYLRSLSKPDYTWIYVVLVIAMLAAVGAGRLSCTLQIQSKSRSTLSGSAH